MTFVLFHGSFNSYEQVKEFWLPEIEKYVLPLGHKIIFPHFPTDSFEAITEAGPQAPAEKQNLETWMQVFGEYYPQIKVEKELVFVGHSLGPLFMLHVLEKHAFKLKRAIFVSPFLTSPGSKWQIDVVNRSFYKSKFDFGKLQKLVPVSEVLYGSDDPYVPCLGQRSLPAKGRAGWSRCLAGSI